MADFTTPATSFPFMPGEVVYQMPSYYALRQMSPPPRNPAVVLSVSEWSFTEIEREDGSRRSVQSRTLARAAHCPDCHAGAVKISHGRLMCPICGGPVIDQPPPDPIVWRRVPMEGWETSIVLYRSIIDPSRSYKQLRLDYDETVVQAQRRMLQRLGLEKPVCRESRENNQLFAILRFYALIEDEAAYLASYFKLTQQAVAFVPLAV